MTEKLEPANETDYFQEFEKYEDIPAEYNKRRCLKETMFANFYEEEIRQELTKCLRVLPHDQNTSGFFITIIRKIRDFDNNVLDPVIEQPRPAEEVKQATTVRPGQDVSLKIQEKSRKHTFEFTRCDPKDPDIEYLKAYYGLGENFPVDQLITQSDEMKKLYFISPEVSKFLYADSTRL